MPPMGLPCQLKLEYLSDDENKVLPEARACFGALQLPVVHSARAEFFRAFNTALECGVMGFDKF